MPRRLTVAGFLFSLWGGPAFAHPHAWIDTSEEVLFDTAGRVTAIRQTWVFDEFYTAETVQASGRGGKADALVSRLIRNLREWNYFTRVKVGGQAVSLGEPLDKSGRVDAGRLIMVFTTPLAQPTEVKGKTLSYAVYDPTYYIEMLHEERPDPVRLVGAPRECQAAIAASQPEASAVAAAAALDRNQSGGKELGANFAEWVEIRCAAGR